jgi:hypothetical protein
VRSFSGVEHGFSEWPSSRYNPRAEGRGFAATSDVRPRPLLCSSHPPASAAPDQRGLCLSQVYSHAFGTPTMSVGVMPAAAAQLGNATEAEGLDALITAAFMDSIKQSHDGMEMAMMFSTLEETQPMLLLLSTDGTLNEHVVREVGVALHGCDVHGGARASAMWCKALTEKRGGRRSASMDWWVQQGEQRETLCHAALSSTHAVPL